MRTYEAMRHTNNVPINVRFFFEVDSHFTTTPKHYPQDVVLVPLCTYTSNQKCSANEHVRSFGIMIFFLNIFLRIRFAHTHIEFQ